jgi:hypothetical protein
MLPEGNLKPIYSLPAVQNAAMPTAVQNAVIPNNIYMFHEHNDPEGLLEELEPADNDLGGNEADSDEENIADSDEKNNAYNGQHGLEPYEYGYEDNEESEHEILIVNVPINENKYINIMNG